MSTDDGRLLLKLSDGSDVLVRPHTKLLLKQPEASGWKYFQLLMGRVRTQIQKRMGGSPAFQIGTPSAVISVRGTKFDVEVDRRGFTEVDVDEGVVELEAVTGRGTVRDDNRRILQPRWHGRPVRKFPALRRICVRSLTVPAAATTAAPRWMMTIPSRACAPLISAIRATTMAAAIQIAADIPPGSGDGDHSIRIRLRFWIWFRWRIRIWTGSGDDHHHGGKPPEQF